MPARRKEATKVVYLRIPESLHMELVILLCDPRTGEPRYGKWNDTLTRVLREWVESKKVARA